MLTFRSFSAVKAKNVGKVCLYFIVGGLHNCSSACTSDVHEDPNPLNLAKKTTARTAASEAAYAKFHLEFGCIKGSEFGRSSLSVFVLVRPRHVTSCRPLRDSASLRRYRIPGGYPPAGPGVYSTPGPTVP